MAEVSSLDAWNLRLIEFDRKFYKDLNETRAIMKMPPIVPSYEWMHIKSESVVPELNSNQSWKESFQKLKEAAEELRAIFGQMAEEMKKLREESEASDSKIVDEPVVPSQEIIVEESSVGKLSMELISAKLTPSFNSTDRPTPTIDQGRNSTEIVHEIAKKEGLNPTTTHLIFNAILGNGEDNKDSSPPMSTPMEFSKETETNSETGVILCASPIDNKTHALGNWNKAAAKSSNTGMNGILKLNFPGFKGSDYMDWDRNCNVYGVFDEMPVRDFKGNDSNTQLNDAYILMGIRIFDPGPLKKSGCGSVLSDLSAGFSEDESRVFVHYITDFEFLSSIKIKGLVFDPGGDDTCIERAEASKEMKFLKDFDKKITPHFATASTTHV